MDYSFPDKMPCERDISKEVQILATLNEQKLGGSWSFLGLVLVFLVYISFSWIFELHVFYDSTGVIARINFKGI